MSTTTSSSNQKEIPEELFFNKDDLDIIRKLYVKKAPYVNKNDVHLTKTPHDGSAKRNIIRSGNSAAGAHKIGKKVSSSDQIDDGSMYEHYNARADPNYDSEEDTDGRELMKSLASADGTVSPMRRYTSEGGEGGGIALLIQDYKKEIDHIIGTHYLKTLEVSAGEIAHVYLSECNSKYEELLRELLAESNISVNESNKLPIYEVIKRAIINSFDYSNFTISGDSFMPTIGGGANRMEAVSLLLVELCSSKDYDYHSQMEAGFDHIFEIINELNKDVPACNTLLSCYLTRCIVDEIVTPSYIANCLSRCDDEAIDGILEDPEDPEDQVGDGNMPPPPPESDANALESPTATAKVLQNLQYTNHSLNSTSMQFTLYCKERNTHIRDVLNKTKVHLSHDHYSAKLQHIWGVNTDEDAEEDAPSSTTKELKHRIDSMLLEYLDNCNTDSTPSKAKNQQQVSLADAATAAAGAAEVYTPPSVEVLMTAYDSLKELGAHTLQYYAHEIVKRGVSIVLLNYRCAAAVLKPGMDLAAATEAYMAANPSAMHLCQHLNVLMYYCMCGEDTDSDTDAAVAAGSTQTSAASLSNSPLTLKDLAYLSPLPPPIISKSQYFTGMNRFFDTIVTPSPCCNWDSPETADTVSVAPAAAVAPSAPTDSVESAPTNTLFYDVMLDAPYAPFLYHQLVMLASVQHGGTPLLSDESKFTQLVASLTPYYNSTNKK